MKKGDKLYTKKHTAEVLEELENDMVGIQFTARDGSEVNYNIVSRKLIEDMVHHKEWFLGEDPFDS